MEVFSLDDKNAPLNKAKAAGLETCTNPFRLMILEDGVSETQLQQAFDILDGKDEFWKGIILDSNKLREKIGQLIAQGKKPVPTKNMDLVVRDKISRYD